MWGDIGGRTLFCFLKGSAMAQPVWVLSVDLQAKTATFQSGMADAARSARNAFKDIGDASNESGNKTAGGLTNVRAGLGLLDNTIRGNHAAAMADIIREFQHTQIVMAALPLAATAGGILLLAGLIVEIAKKVKEWREEQQHLTEEQLRFATAVDNAYKSLDEKILQAGIRTDELANNHLGALHKQLQLIDKQSMSELVQEFGLVAKAADEVFGHLQTSWYQMGIGSAGAKHALDEFALRYNALLAQGKDKEASDLLGGTKASAEAILAAQRQAAANELGNTGGRSDGKSGDYQKYLQAVNTLKSAGVGYTDKEIQAQTALVGALTAQAGIQTRVAELQKIQSGNATTSTGKEAATRDAEAAREAADHKLRMGEMAIAAQREAAAAELSIHEASIQERLASDVALADKEREVQLRANADQIAALDKGGKDYQNQLKALQDKGVELEQQHADTVAALRDKANVEQYRKELTDLQQSEREKIEAADQGSAERLAAIDAAIREEQAKGLQLTAFYRELLTMRVSVQKAAQSEEDKLRADAGKEAADHIARMGQLSIAAEREHQALQDSARHMTDQLRLAEALKVAEEEYQIEENAHTLPPHEVCGWYGVVMYGKRNARTRPNRGSEVGLLQTKGRGRVKSLGMTPKRAPPIIYLHKRK